jgi:hypothetical protein
MEQLMEFELNTSNWNKGSNYIPAEPEMELRLAMRKGITITIAIRGGPTLANGAQHGGYAGKIVIPHCEPLYYLSPAITREANTIYALAFRRARVIIQGIIGPDDYANYLFVTQKAGLEVRLNVAGDNIALGGWRTNSEPADAIDLWSPVFKHHCAGNIRFQEFTGFKQTTRKGTTRFFEKKAPPGFKQLYEMANGQRELARNWDVAAYRRCLGDTYDRWDIANYRGNNARQN